VYLSLCLNLLQALLKLTPMIHNRLRPTRLRKHLSHLLHLLLPILDAINPHVPDERNPRPHGSSSPTPAILHRHALLGLNPQLLTRIEVDLRVRLAARRRQARRRTVHMLIREETINAHFLETRHHPGLRARAHDAHRIPLRLDLLQLSSHAIALDCFGGQLGGDGAELAVDVFVELLGGHGEVVFLLEADHHPAEVVAHEVLEELVDCVALGEAMFLEELVCEIRAGFEGEALGEDEGVVAV
jgi:hypothetical protein